MALALHWWLGFGRRSCTPRLASPRHASRCIGSRIPLSFAFRSSASRTQRRLVASRSSSVTVSSSSSLRCASSSFSSSLRFALRFSSWQSGCAFVRFVSQSGLRISDRFRTFGILFDTAPTVSLSSRLSESQSVSVSCSVVTSQFGVLVLALPTRWRVVVRSRSRSPSPCRSRRCSLPNVRSDREYRPGRIRIAN